jgi:hypothetical protein
MKARVEVGIIGNGGHRATVYRERSTAGS